YHFNIKYIFWLYKNAKQYDMVILDGLWSFSVTGGYILKMLGVPYCVYTHGMLDPYFNENKIKYIKKLPFWFLVERNVIAFANKVLFTCAEEMKLANNSFPFFKANSAIATLGVEKPVNDNELILTEFFHEYPRLKNKRIFLFLSRVHPKKGLELLIDAVSELEDFPEDIVFLIAGPGALSYREDLEVRCRDLGISNRFEWVGMLSGQTKWAAFYSAECFILPSHQENFGIVVAEALSTGTPVLITNKVNIWTEIETEMAGFVADDNKEGIRSLISSWIALSKQQKLEFNNNALRCYEKHFSIQTAVVDFCKAVDLDVS
ncbi:MAG: glycosyltransferase, partial [Aliiglaciecola sp.]|uniref:glycosyltransferase n=1 Tax=Aliiglaciecola sp. TaxID=1872441 RepID=UPI0032990238